MKNSKEVDWSKAPEGATHYNAELFCPWLKDSPSSYFAGDGWFEYKSDDGLWEVYFNNAVKRPEWDGSGVPPVGTVCEYRLNDGSWFTCKIVYVLSGTDDCFVAYCEHLSTDQFLTFSSRRYKLQLRKIKTPEQLAAEERLHAIDEMLDFVVPCITYRNLIGALYDEGYRKTEVKK